MKNQALAVMCLILLFCPKVQASQVQLSEIERAKIMHEEWQVAKPLATQAVSGVTVKPVINKESKAEELPKIFQTTMSLRSEDMLLSELLKSIGHALRHNVILGPGVEDKKVSIDVKDKSIEMIINTILFPMNYGFKVQHGDLIILAQETRVFRVVLPPVTQAFDDITSNESFVQSKDGTQSSTPTNQQVKVGTKVLVENSSSGISFWDDINNNLKTLLTNTGQFSINKPSGSVIITDTPAALEKVGSYFEDLNKRVSQQIEVDVKVIEVNINDENRMGVDWNALAQNLKALNGLGLATNFASGNFTSGNFFKFNADGSKPGSGVSSGGIRFVLDALAKQGRVEVVSQPKVVILNNQVAVIQVGSTQSYVDRSTFETTQTGTITSLSTNQVQEGVTMRLIGNIVGDQIYLSVAPVVTTIDNIRTITSGSTTIEAPQTTTKSINTLVKLQEGETVAIGGLITSSKERTKEGVPVISKVPILGRLFEYNKAKDVKSELIIFITPRKV